jgi:flagellar biosynthesis GTPase FlhF
MSAVSVIRARRSSAGKVRIDTPTSAKSDIKNIPYRHGQTPEFVANHFTRTTSKNEKALLNHAKKTEDVEAKLKKFTSFVSKRKSKKKVDKRKNEWIQEWQRLCSNEKETISEIFKTYVTQYAESDFQQENLRREWREMEQYIVQSIKLCVDSPEPLVLIRGLKRRTVDALLELKEQEDMISVDIDTLYSQCIESDPLQELEKIILSTDYLSNQEQAMNRVREDLNIEVPFEYGEDETLRQEMIFRIFTLERDYAERIKKEVAAYRDAIHTLYGHDDRPSSALSIVSDLSASSATTSLFGGTMAGSGSSSSLGGWTADEHFQFLKALKDFNARTSGTQPEDHQRSTMYQRLAIYLNGKKTLKEIDVHDTWWMTRTRYKRRLKMLRAQYLGEARPKLIEGVRTALHLTVMLYEAHIRHEDELQEMESKKNQVHERLDHLREQKETRDREKAMQEEEERKALEMERERNERREEMERAKAKLALLEAREKKKELERQEREKEMQLERERRIHDDIVRQHNKERVDHRRREQQHKEEERYERIREENEEMRRKEERLDRLREEVRDKLGLDRVDRDFERLLKRTEGSLMGEESERVSGFTVTHGYADSELMKDIRFRLHVALCDAGMIDTTYAKQVLQQVKPLKAQRVDMMTSEQRFG